MAEVNWDPVQTRRSARVGSSHNIFSIPPYSFKIDYASKSGAKVFQNLYRQVKFDYRKS